MALPKRYSIRRLLRHTNKHRAAASNFSLQIRRREWFFVKRLGLFRVKQQGSSTPSYGTEHEAVRKGRGGDTESRNGIHASALDGGWRWKRFFSFSFRRFSSVITRTKVRIEESVRFCYCYCSPIRMLGCMCDFIYILLCFSFGLSFFFLVEKASLMTKSWKQTCCILPAPAFSLSSR